MKIYAFDVREDEKEYFRYFAEKFECEVNLTTERLCMESVGECKGYDGVTILGNSKVDCEMIDRFCELGIKFLSTRTIGYNNIDIAYAKEKGIRVCNAQYAPDSVADFTIMMMLMALRKYKPALYRQNVNDFSLSGLIGKTMRSMTVGVIGTGQIGTAVIESLQGFGCRVLAYNRSESEHVKEMAEYVDLDTLYRESDMISIHLPLNDSTRKMISAGSMTNMKDGVILINTARGELMDVKSLIWGIETCKIGALAMDVFENENDIYHTNHVNDIITNQEMAYLRQFPNVILTQHMAFYTESAVSEMVECAVEGLKMMMEGNTYKCEIKVGSSHVA